MGIRAEFEHLASIQQAKDEDLYRYIVRLTETVDRFIDESDELFNSLSKEAQLWLNDAVTRYNKRIKLPELPQELTTATEKPSSSSPSSKEPKLKVSTVEVRKTICQNFVCTLDQIKQKLVDSGINFKVSTLNTLYTDTRATIKVLAGMKKLKVDLGIALDEKKTKTGMLRELICSNDSFNVAQIKQELQKQSLECPDSTVSVVYSDTKATLKILQDLQMI